MVAPTTTTVHTTVDRTTEGSDGSANSCLYLSNPAEPRTNPLLLILRNEVRTIS